MDPYWFEIVISSGLNSACDFNSLSNLLHYWIGFSKAMNWFFSTGNKNTKINSFFSLLYVLSNYSLGFGSMIFGSLYLVSDLGWTILVLNFVLQAIRLKYLHPDSELQNFALQIMDMLRADSSVDAQALVSSLINLELQFCFLYSYYVEKVMHLISRWPILHCSRDEREMEVHESWEVAYHQFIISNIYYYLLKKKIFPIFTNLPTSVV